MRGHAPNITKEVENVVVAVKGTNPKYAANQIRKHIKDNLKIFRLKDNQVPSVRSMQVILSKPENRRKVKKIMNNPLDKPWSIGSCEEYNIPADIIPTLIEWEQVGQPKFTIRQARWFARLKLVVFEMSEKKRPLEYWLSGLAPIVTNSGARFIIPAPHDDSRFNLLANIAYLYAAHEQVTEVRGETYRDTSDLDFEIFTEGKLHGMSVSEIDSLSSEEFEAQGGMVVSAEELERRGYKSLLHEHLERHGIKIVWKESEEGTEQSSPGVKDAET